MDNYDKMYIGGLVILFVAFITISVFQACKFAEKQKIPVVYIERNISPIPYDYLGEYIITHYCDCPICTKSPKGSKTASGTKPKEGRTIACDGEILKTGDIVYVEKYGIRVCEDKGSAVKGRKIDVFVNEHSKAQKLGIKKAKVYRIGE